MRCNYDSGRLPSKILKRMEMQPPYSAGLHPERLHEMPVWRKEGGGVTMAKYNHTKQEWKNALIFSKKVSLFPDAPEPGNKEYIAGYTTALHKNSMIDCAEAEKDRNRIVKELRADGWQTWTEPGASIGGLGTKEYSFSAMRTKEVV